MLLGCITVLLAAISLLYVKQEVSEIRLEAGEAFDERPELYFKGSPLAMKLIEPSKVLPDTKLPQSYVVKYYLYGILTRQVHVDVVDTTPPDIALVETEPGFAKGQNIVARDLLTTCEDNAYGEVSVTFASGQKEISFAEYGSYPLTIVATDANLNESRATIMVHVANPPIILGPTDFYVVRNQRKVDAERLLSYIEVLDEQDGAIDKDELTVQFSNFDDAKEGDYSLQITAQNSYNVRAVKTFPVHVVDEKNMTDRLVLDEKLLTSVVLDGDTGSRTPFIMKGDLSLAQDYAKRNEVSILYELGGGTYAYGNGVVLDLTDDSVYIASNYHVFGRYADYRAMLQFADGSKTDNYTYLGGNEACDIAFIRLDLDALSEEIRQYLLEPRLSIARAKTIETGESVFRTSLYQNKAPQTVQGIFNTYSIKIFTGQSYSSFQVDMKQGDSGSGIYDQYGYLISICSGIAHENGRTINCGVRMEDIVSEFERCTGKCLYAY